MVVVAAVVSVCRYYLLLSLRLLALWPRFRHALLANMSPDMCRSHNDDRNWTFYKECELCNYNICNGIYLGSIVLVSLFFVYMPVDAYSIKWQPNTAMNYFQMFSSNLRNIDSSFGNVSCTVYIFVLVK